MNYFSKVLLIAAIALPISSCGILRDMYSWQRNYLAPLHTLESNIEYEVIWNFSYIQAPELTAAPGKIIIEGLKKGNLMGGTILVIDSNSGKTLWEIPSSSFGAFAVHKNTLYRGTTGSATIHANNIDDGKLQWSTWLPSAHSVLSIYVANNKIFVFSSDNEFYVLDEHGKILEKTYETSDIFLVIDSVLYIEKVYSLKAVDYLSREEIWQFDIGESFHVPFFDGGEIFLKTKNSSPLIYSIDQYTGKLNWVSTQTPQSNFCLIGDKVYFTTPDGELVAINRYSSIEKSRVKFSPVFDLNKQIGDYYIACDTTNNVLAISFGDNTQIMGLKILNP